MTENEKLLSQLIKQLRSEETRWDAMLEIKLLNDSELVPSLIRYLDDPDWVIRWCVSEKLGELKAPSAIPALTRLLADRDFHVRKNAIKALVKFGPEVCAYLVTQYSHPHFSVRRHISLVIGHFGPKCVPYIIKDFALRDWVSANRIVHAIFDIDVDDKADILLELIDVVDVQKPIVIMMGELQHPRSVPQLIRLYKNQKLRRCILESIQKIGDKQAYPVLVSAVRKGGAAVRPLAEQLVLKIGKPILPYLVKGLGDPGSANDRLIALIETIGPHAIMPSIHRLAARNPGFELIVKELLTKYPDNRTDRKNPIGGILNIFGDLGDSLLR